MIHSVQRPVPFLTMRPAKSCRVGESTRSYVTLPRALDGWVSKAGTEPCCRGGLRPSGLEHTWKKNLTTKTWRAPMQMTRAIWIKLKLTILPSVLRTVLKFRFSRVRKYFWFRVMVESWPESLKSDSSRAVVCSGELPCFDGRVTLDSPST